jgi:hypothetical protein
VIGSPGDGDVAEQERAARVDDRAEAGDGEGGGEAQPGPAHLRVAAVGESDHDDDGDEKGEPATRRGHRLAGAGDEPAEAEEGRAGAECGDWREGARRPQSH